MEVSTAETEVDRLKRFHRDVLALALVLTDRGPRDLETEMKDRFQHLRRFFDEWIAHSRVGRPTKGRLECLWTVILERGWLADHETADQAVTYLRERIRGRASRRLTEATIGQTAVQSLLMEPVGSSGYFDAAVHDIRQRVLALPEPDASLVVGRLKGFQWDDLAQLLGIDHNAMRRARRRIRKEFSDLMVLEANLTLTG